MMKQCKNCQESFEITDEDLKFYEKVSPVFGGKKYLIPAPSLCPECRQQRRLCFRNERNLYKRKCDLCKKDIISTYSPDKEYIVYCPNCWWSDEWNPSDFQKDYNCDQDFFVQFQQLDKQIPKISLILLGDNINSDYTHDNYKLKNCYLVFDGEQAIDCTYGETFGLLKDCLDFQYLFESELCYEVLNSKNIYDCKFCYFSNNCSNCWFLMDCIGCKNCFGCINLRNKEYCIFNEFYSKEEYLQKINSFNLNSSQSIENLKNTTKEFFLKFPRKASRNIMCENINGDNLTNCKDTFDSFDCKDARDCKFCTNVQMSANDCYDVDIWGDNMNLVYNCECAGAGAQNIICSLYAAINANNIIYSNFCTRGCSNLFGCVGLRKKDYCILNKQYTKEEYEKLVPKIIEQMRTPHPPLSGGQDQSPPDKGDLGGSFPEWGEFFPALISPFGYNETVAQEYFPLTKFAVGNADLHSLQRFNWSDYEPEFPCVEKIIPANLLPDNINDIPDDILNWAIQSEVQNVKQGVATPCLYKIIKPELDFYRKMNLPIPRRHPDQRHKDRMALRNPRKLWKRNCMKCGMEIQTTYSPDRSEIVYCEKCYLESVY